ncbi:Nitrilase and fragile histidine triad fusion protein [Carabus blaptoides fortunei]
MIRQSLFRLYYSNLRSINRVPGEQAYFAMETKADEDGIKVAVCQMTSTNNKEDNLVVVKNLIEQARKAGAAMAFLPEACDYIAPAESDPCELAETLGDTVMSQYKDMAIHNKIWLSIGGFHERTKSMKIYNTHVIIDSNGEIRATYRKVHLFNTNISNLSLNESLTVNCGNDITQPIRTPIGMLGLMICYDLRFPELSTLLTKLGATVLTYPSAFTHTTGKAHWEQLLRARAIENQCYVIAAAQVGKHNEKRCSHGRAMIVDPWGNIIAQCSEYMNEENLPGEIAIARIDLKLIDRIREQMPVFCHRRHDVYNLQMVARNPITRSEYERFADKIIPCSTVFLCSSYCFAFTNIRCVVPGHVLVASKRVTPRLSDLNHEEIANLFQTVVKVQTVLEKVHNATSSTIVVQDGKEAGQTIPHVHVHILPRKEGDFARNDDIYDALARHDNVEEITPLRTIDEMTAEADLLKALLN